MQDLLAQVRRAFAQLPPARRAALVGAVAGVLVLLLLVARWASQPDYALLFGSLSPADAGRVVEQLDTEGVQYSLRDGGTAIYVPREEVYDLRLRLATEGVVADGPVGYELFDGGTLGMTDFMQRLNVKRALEGELARTIASVQQVEQARVHLVLPERSPFRDQQTPPSASVVLSVRGPLSPEQVAGVTALVAGAVEGMSPGQVTVIDEAGRLLAGPQADGGGAAGLSSAQLRMRQEVEDHLARAGQTMLDQLLGPGRAVVRVSADLDLSRTETEANRVDPESQTMISEERQEEAGENGTGSQSTVRNYELSRETVRAQRDAGEIRTLTVSVLLDEAAPPAGDEGAAEPTPFTDAQLRQIESLVKNAVGFSDERGDRFAVQQLRFNPDGGVGRADAAAAQRAEWIALGVRYGIILLALFLGYRLLRSLVRRLDAPAEATTLPPVGTAPVLDVTLPDYAGDGASVPLPEMPRTTIEAVEGDPYAAKLEGGTPADLLAEVSTHVQSHPVDAAAIVRAWLEEDAAAEAAR